MTTPREKKMLDFPSYTSFRTKFGAPFRRSGKCSVQMNQSFFAALLSSEEKLMAVGTSEWYQAKAGIWKTISEVEIQGMIETLIRRLSNETDTPEPQEQITGGLLTSIEKLARIKAYSPEFPSMPEDLIPCMNGALSWNETAGDWEHRALTADLNIRFPLAVRYDPNASYAFFLEKLREIFPDEDDMRVCQEYLGVALFTKNLTHNFLYLYGEGGSGKSILVLLLIGILGTARTLDIDVKALGEKYELSALEDQTLLVASETSGDALCTVGAAKIKKIVGGDLIMARKKFKNEVRPHFGNYSLVLTSNHKMKFRFEGSGREWKRRLLPVFFSKMIDPPDKTFVSKLLSEHASGIFNWFLEGAARVRRNHWEIRLSAAQEALRDSLIGSSHPMQNFVESHIVRSLGDSISSADVLEAYNRGVGIGTFPPLTPEAFYKQFSGQMAETFGGTGGNTIPGKGGGKSGYQRGYHGFKLSDVLARVHEKVS